MYTPNEANRGFVYAAQTTDQRIERIRLISGPAPSDNVCEVL